MKKNLFVVTIEEVYDQEIYSSYIKQVLPIIKAHNGEYIARSNNIVPFAGKEPERSIIIAFNSIEEGKSCFYSEDYEKIKHLRESSTKSRAFFIIND